MKTDIEIAQECTMEPIDPAYVYAYKVICLACTYLAT